jgi:Zn-finger nucleic acid-binding protein
MRIRSCPDHPDAMDALCLSASDGGTEIEIDRCVECGSLWFDAGELEMAASLHARPASGESEHPCPCCKKQMRAASLPRGMFAHRCDSCRGTFLDAKTVAALKSDKLPRPPERKAKGHASVGFICVKCSGKFPYAKGNATNKGLMCPGCVVNPQVERITRGPTSTYRASGRGAVGLDIGFLDVFDSLADLFGD